MFHRGLKESKNFIRAPGLSGNTNRQRTSSWRFKRPPIWKKRKDQCHVSSLIIAMPSVLGTQPEVNVMLLKYHFQIFSQEWLRIITAYFIITLQVCQIKTCAWELVMTNCMRINHENLHESTMKKNHSMYSVFLVEIPCTQDDFSLSTFVLYFYFYRAP